MHLPKNEGQLSLMTPLITCKKVEFEVMGHSSRHMNER